ncbi:DUF3976 domain-containing protein [Halobacillus sp. A5]|uniref:DUF3976 domain-containing protein n=1 Tax=Halobacillus sp. A5 TaxID=2880263 RepID=UPI0020A6A887|nr:DUF3976 domain-containing protein [Halobacillus sp. A5]MCP3026497.1 DUF3976 domain-containing protein [Halobacillus sp. A5]
MWFFPVIVIAGFIGIYLWAKDDINGSSITKRGFIKMLIGFVGILLVSLITVAVTN